MFDQDRRRSEASRRWTLTACPECGLQAPLGYQCSGGGDAGHSLNVPVVEVVVREDRVTGDDLAAALTAVRKTVAYRRFLNAADFRLTDELARVVAMAILRGGAAQ